MVNEALAQRIEKITDLLDSPKAAFAEIDSRVELKQLALCEQWTSAEFLRVDFLSKRIDISGKLFFSYHSNGRKASDSIITEQLWLELLVAILIKALLYSQAGGTKALLMKRFNVFFKALDLVQPTWLEPDSEIGGLVDDLWRLSTQPVEPLEIAITSPTRLSEKPELRTIPLTVLFYEGPIARAYLATLRSMGLKPEKIIELVAARDLATGKMIGRWLPRSLRLNYAGTIQRNKIHYWPKKLLKKRPGLIEEIDSAVHEQFGFDLEVLKEANKLLPLSVYSESVESLMITGLTDPKLHGYLKKEADSALLFTGGGMVPATLLQLTHLRFLHIHPGYLPDTRGADCTLWSSLLQGRMSASCFYMSPGIDTGDIILPCWLPEFSVRSDCGDIDSQSLYRATYAFVDPWVRAFVFREILMRYSSFTQLESFSQSDSAGTTFHFMHEQLKRAAFLTLYKGIPA